MSQPEKSAEKQPRPRLDFKKAAQEILRDHPGMAGRLLFIDPVTHEKHGTLRARLRGLLHKPFRQRLSAAFKAANDNRGVIADIIRLKQVNAVLLTTERESPQEALFDLHRQAARIVVPHGRGVNTFFQALFDIPYAAHMAAADGYAAIRYLRQPEADPEFLNRLSLKRAADFLRTGDPENLSSAVIDKIMADRDFSKLKPQDLGETVGIYVQGFTPNRAQSEALVKEFAPMKGKGLDAEGLKMLAGITAASQNPLAVKLGKKVLDAAGPPAPVAETKSAPAPKSTP